MARSRKRKPKPPRSPETALEQLLEKHLDYIRTRNYSDYTIKSRRIHIQFFLKWCRERGITEPLEVTRTVLEAYQRHVFHYRKKNGEPLAFTGQQDRLVPLRVWFKWMARSHHVLHNPASELEMPKLGFRLPKAVLTAAEAEQTLLSRRSMNRSASAIARFSNCFTRRACAGWSWRISSYGISMPNAEPSPSARAKEKRTA